MAMTPSYRQAVAWIGDNDDAGGDEATDTEIVSGYVTVALVADMWAKRTDVVAKDVVSYRKKQNAKH